jgi:DNA invertase Pin-like site-specific DNA recombinase
MKYGYARVSSTSQNLTIQMESLKNAGCETIRKEKVSGTSMQGREELKVLLDFLRDGDELIVTRVDRLARSVFDLQEIIKTLDEKGVTLSATEQPISTKDATSKCFLDMLSVFAEFETNLRKERQMEGIAKAKEKGVYKGRKPSVDIDKVKELKESGLGASQIARELKIGRASVYRALDS